MEVEDYTIRPCRSLDELSACVTLHQQIWGYDESETYPVRFFVTLNETGGMVLGAFAPGGEMVGFVAAMAAWRSQQRYYHSMMLGVIPAHENRGLGRALKLEQRRVALARGVDLIEWTFDPMRARNAALNIGRLGAIARRYLVDHYGTVNSRFQQGLPSDRLVAEWWLRSGRVERAIVAERKVDEDRVAVNEVSIPLDFDALRALDPQQARQLQLAVRGQLQESFAWGRAVTGVRTDGNALYYSITEYPDA
jgi:predicted GNAT superfamily acetyltransferase